jgi:3-oxoacyl-[acyl-carrier-protein] synthase-1
VFAQALSAIQAQQAEAVIVGGIDSYYDPDLLEWLDQEMRLHGLECENGFIPGEAAAFVVVARRGSATGMYHYAQVLGASVRPEPRPYGNPDPCHGLGMTAALREAIAPVGVSSRRVGWVGPELPLLHARSGARSAAPQDR